MEVYMMFDYTEADETKVINGYFTSINPLRLRLFPPKQKKQYIVLKIICKILDGFQMYSENELNEILKEIYPDFVTLRRGLIDYKLLLREKDGSKYWVNKKD
jgi:hypothetical protein